MISAIHRPRHADDETRCSGGQEYYGTHKIPGSALALESRAPADTGFVGGHRRAGQYSTPIATFSVQLVVHVIQSTQAMVDSMSCSKHRQLQIQCRRAGYRLPPHATPRLCRGKSVRPHRLSARQASAWILRHCFGSMILRCGKWQLASKTRYRSSKPVNTPTTLMPISSTA